MTCICIPNPNAIALCQFWIVFSLICIVLEDWRRKVETKALLKKLRSKT